MQFISSEAPVPYEIALQEMERLRQHAPLVWFVEHPEVYTVGQNGTVPEGLSVCRSRRGGNMIYHGPGQLMIYAMCDIRKTGIQAHIDWLTRGVGGVLESLGCTTHGSDHPGLWVNQEKIAFIGLDVRRGITAHGLALNLSVDLSKFARIAPCGRQGMAVTSLAALGFPYQRCKIEPLLQTVLG